ncbi:hypothetical protein BDN72DRAFT_323326 [Pluteus cervinus]|uniref:Uncharacterized protein n=1 Tax=Pluteus cervinus TaxID=181527 RepID=A0ACD3ACJ6_9AGAR|nr:hypothetical protein BDN72DRAFT_323326 [Pluteus cervinus]
MSQLGKAQLLSIYLPSETTPLRPLSEAMWMQPAPTLLGLRLDHASICRRNIFSGVFPQLTELHLAFCEFDWDIPLISNPTSTSLHTVYNTKKVTVTRLLRLLQSLPCLVDYEESHCLERSSIHEPPVARCVRLPNIKTLSTSDDENLSLDLLRGLEAPQASITTSHGARYPSVVKRTLSDFQDAFGHKWNGVHSLRSRQDPKYCEFSISTTETTTYSFSVLTFSDSWSHFNFVKFACQNLPVQNLQSCSTNRLSVEAANLLGRLRWLNKLRLIGESAVQPFIAALGPTWNGNDPVDINEDSGAPSDYALPFRALQQLALVKMEAPAAYNGLLGVLTSRKASGIGLKNLTLSKSKIIMADIAPLTLVVDVVSFDA